MENTIETYTTYILVSVGVIVLIGSLITAFLHGLGFSLFGFKHIKPNYKRRYVLQIISIAIWFAIFSGVTEIPERIWTEIFSRVNKVPWTKFPDVPSSILTNPELLSASLVVIIAITISLMSHVILSIATYCFFDAKGNFSAALKSPLIISALLFSVMVIPLIVMMFKQVEC